MKARLPEPAPPAVRPGSTSAGVHRARVKESADFSEFATAALPPPEVPRRTPCADSAPSAETASGCSMLGAATGDWASDRRVTTPSGGNWACRWRPLPRLNSPYARQSSAWLRGRTPSMASEPDSVDVITVPPAKTTCRLAIRTGVPAERIRACPRAGNRDRVTRSRRPERHAPQADLMHVKTISTGDTLDRRVPLTKLAEVVTATAAAHPGRRCWSPAPVAVRPSLDAVRPDAVQPLPLASRDPDQHPFIATVQCDVATTIATVRW